MGTASRFNEVLNKELKISAAWLPMANPFALGDYGVVSDGIFSKIGNVESDFQIVIKKRPGENLVLKFASEDVEETRLEGDLTVPAFTNSPTLEGRLLIQFKSANSFFLRSSLTAIQMQNIAGVAREIFNSPKWDAWSYNYRVVSTVYHGKDCALLSAISGGASVELSGKADALSQLDLGSAAVGLTASAKKSIGLDLVGKNGVVALRFFKLTWFGGGRPKVLADRDLSKEYFASEAELRKDDI
jgi:hypothetical protein